jgi:hypothetical protein
MIKEKFAPFASRIPLIDSAAMIGLGWEQQKISQVTILSTLTNIIKHSPEYPA